MLVKNGGPILVKTDTLRRIGASDLFESICEKGAETERRAHTGRSDLSFGRGWHTPGEPLQ